MCKINDFHLNLKETWEPIQQNVFLNIKNEPILISENIQYQITLNGHITPIINLYIGQKIHFYSNLPITLYNKTGHFQSNYVHQILKILKNNIKQNIPIPIMNNYINTTIQADTIIFYPVFTATITEIEYNNKNSKIKLKTMV